MVVTINKVNENDETNLANVPSIPSHKSTVEATQYAFLRYMGAGGPFKSKYSCASEFDSPSMVARCVATMTYTEIISN